MAHTEPPPTAAVLPELPTLEDVATLLFPAEYAADQETLEKQGYSEPEIDAINDYLAEVYRQREDWISSVTMRADVLDADDDDYPEADIFEALKQAAHNVQRHNDILDSLVALAVKHTSVSSRTVESTISMGHNAVRRRADNGDTPEVRALVATLLRRQAQQYIDAAEQMEG